MAWTPPYALQRRDGIHERECFLRVVTVGTSKVKSEWNTAAITDQVTFGTRFCSIGRIGTGLLPPKTALIELPSITARDQSILSERASQSKATKWISCQIPASCQSRNRRQQVMPEPHPSSRGSISQGMRCATQTRFRQNMFCLPNAGLPPLAFGFETGMKGAISSHNWSGRSAADTRKSSQARNTTPAEMIGGGNAAATYWKWRFC